MTHQCKALQLSLLIHATVVAAIIAATALLHGPNRPIIMNFDLARPQNEPAGITEQPARRSSVERINHAERKARPVPDRVLETIAKPEEEKKIVKETQQYVPPAILHVSPAAVEVMRGGDADKIDRSPAGDNVQKGGAAIGGPTSDYATGSLTGTASRGQGEGHDGSGRTRFLATHYSYIRDRILRNIGYPDVARRMKWEGKVLISFIITAEGNVEEIKVVQSSGFKVLDGNAVEAIVTAAPYPKPPVAAQIIIPIIYNLYQD